MIFRTLKSATKSAGKGIRSDPELRKIINRYPRFFAFMKKRLTPDEKFGLYLTVGVLVSAIFAYIFFSILEDFFKQDILIMSDLRILNLVKMSRNPILDREMLFLTYFGKSQIIFAGFLAVSFFLVFLGRFRYLITLGVSVIFEAVFVSLVKNLVDRARPPLSVALIKEEGFSFPSGHAFIACSFYGMLGYFIYRSAKKKLTKAVIVIVSLLLILGIGFSRIYLGVHWPSDVFASFAAGAAWVTVLITILEIRRKFGKTRGKIAAKERNHINTLELICLERRKQLPWRCYFMVSRNYNKSVKFLAVALFAIWLAFIGYFYKTHAIEKIKINQETESPKISLSRQDMPNNFFINLPRVSESIGGKPMEPINIIVVGDYGQLTNVFFKAGWFICDRLSTGNLEKLIVATFTGKSYFQAPGVPSIWNAVPNDLAFEKPTETVKARDHIHFWNTPFLVEGKTKVWFGTAHFDQTIKLKSSIIFPTHSIDPAIDKERDKIKEELINTGKIDDSFEFQVVDPTMGKNQVGDEFFTDGKAYVFFLAQ